MINQSFHAIKMSQTYPQFDVLKLHLEKVLSNKCTTLIIGGKYDVIVNHLQNPTDSILFQ